MIVMRSCKKDGTSHNGFQWPTEAGVEVVCPDWDSEPKCGNGFHGLLPGQNDPGVWYGELIYFLDVDEVVDLGGKVKFEKCRVLFVGEPADAWAWAHLNAPGAWYGGTATAGDGGTATAGDYGTATAGDYGTATAGYYGTATAGDYGTATAGDEGILCIKQWDGPRYRMKVAYVGEDGIKPNTPYKLNANGEFVEVKSPDLRREQAKRDAWRLYMEASK